ncbi:hypothetical protein DFH08DRAFT_930699 [Mycena albidolilacea]|uniref:Uncharacterized protein n=1 Tax=Mycena albidolilacea TaxID=1033008 RepID=A0AAD7F0P5_9AGAR|nr:hypothetical protein DFH08DRAFT_930699 [Mycena albidolilacea]
MKNSVILFSLFAGAAFAAPASRRLRARQNGACTDRVINFDDAQFDSLDANTLTPIPDGFQGFNWPDFATTSCPGDACKSFPANTTQIFTGPRLAMAEGLVGGLLTDQFVPKTSPSAQFNLADQAESFDLKDFAVFDIIDLPEQVKLGAKEDMRVHLECTKAGADDKITKTIIFDRNKDSAGYQVTADQVSEFTALSGCKISTTQVFFPGKVFELEIPTESMGIDNLNVCVR